MKKLLVLCSVILLVLLPVVSTIAFQGQAVATGLAPQANPYPAVPQPPPPPPPLPPPPPTPVWVWVVILLGCMLVMSVYFLPTIIALIRRKRNKMLTIVLLNIFGGWTLVGWIIALVLSTRSD